ncbi:MAG: hypothetical protein JSW37_13500, partial [Anaerolineales bacterium]
MSTKSLTGYEASMGSGLRPLRDRRITEIVVALCCFALPILLTPLAARESGTDVWARAGLPKFTIRRMLIPDAALPPLYAMAADRGVYRSVDNGVTWEAVNNGLPSAQWGRIAVQALAADVDNPSVLYAGLAEIGNRDSAFGMGLYVSDDGGSTWLVLGREMAGKAVQAIAVMPALTPSPVSSSSDSKAPNPVSVVLVATNVGLYRSVDHGQSWSRLDWRGTEIRILSLAIGPGNPDVVYVGTQGGGIFGTEDGGASWAAMNRGLDNLDVRHISISVSEPRVMFVATDGGVYRSLDAGTSWTKLGGPTEGRRVNTIALHPLEASVVCAGLEYGGACCSVDGGTQWALLERGLAAQSVLSLTFDPLNASVLWAGTTDGVWRYVFAAAASQAATRTVPAPAWTLTVTPTVAPTSTRQPSATASPTASMTHTATVTPTASRTPSPTATHTSMPSATPTPTFTPTSTPKPAPPPPTAPPPSPTPVPVTPTQTL